MTMINNNYSGDRSGNDNSRSVTYNTTILLHPDAVTDGLREWKERLLDILGQLPENAGNLRPVIQLIVAAIAPSKIYMLRHKDWGLAGYGGYIDLLVIIPGSCGRPFAELEPVLEMAYLRDSRVSCSLHSEGNVAEALRNGHPFYSLNCIPQNLVYDDGKASFPETSGEVMLGLKEKLLQKFTGYHVKAVEFFEGAVFLRQKQSFTISMFMLHQAAELSFRGVLKSLNGYDKKTHEIHNLRKSIRRCAPQMANVFPADTDGEKQLLSLLDNAYLGARYDDSYPVSEGELAILFERVGRLQETAVKVFEHTVGALGVKGKTL